MYNLYIYKISILNLNSCRSFLLVSKKHWGIGCLGGATSIYTEGGKKLTWSTHLKLTYCWWTKSCTTKDDDNPIIYRAYRGFYYPAMWGLQLTRWFQIFFIFTPTWGNDPIWRAYFSDGLVQPPTRTARPWKLMVGRRITFLFGKVTFQGLCEILGWGMPFGSWNGTHLGRIVKKMQTYPYYMLHGTGIFTQPFPIQFFAMFHLSCR